VTSPVTNTGELAKDTAQRYFTGVWDALTNTGLAHRASNVSVPYGDANVVLFDNAGRPLLVAVDMDTGAGTAYRSAVGLLVASAGGPVLVPGDDTNGLKVQVTSPLQVGDVAIGDVNILSAPAVIPPSAVINTPVNGGNSVTADQDAVVAAATGLRLYGYSVMEDAAAPNEASFRIMHGATAAGGIQVEPVSLTANESTSDYWGPEGIDTPNGISVDWISGSFKMSLKTKVVV
jgi:hypothetical protein